MYVRCAYCLSVKVLPAHPCFCAQSVTCLPGHRLSSYCSFISSTRNLRKRELSSSSLINMRCLLCSYHLPSQFLARIIIRTSSPLTKLHRLDPRPQKNVIWHASGTDSSRVWQPPTRRTILAFKEIGSRTPSLSNPLF